jgi:hypothetical protein
MSTFFSKRQSVQMRCLGIQFNHEASLEQWGSSCSSLQQAASGCDVLLPAMVIAHDDF